MINSIVDIYNLIKNDAYLRAVLDIDNINVERGLFTALNTKKDLNLFLNHINFHFDSVESTVELLCNLIDVRVPRYFVDKNIIDTKLFIEISEFIFRYTKSAEIIENNFEKNILKVTLPNVTLYRHRYASGFKLSSDGLFLTVYPNTDYCILTCDPTYLRSIINFPGILRYEIIFLHHIKALLKSLELENFFKEHPLKVNIKEILNKFLDIIEKEEMK